MKLNEVLMIKSWERQSDDFSITNSDWSKVFWLDKAKADDYYVKTNFQSRISVRHFVSWKPISFLFHLCFSFFFIDFYSFCLIWNFASLVSCIFVLKTRHETFIMLPTSVTRIPRDNLIFKKPHDRLYLL